MKTPTKPKALKGRKMIARGEAPGTDAPHPHPSRAQRGEAPAEHHGETAEALRELNAFCATDVMEWTVGENVGQFWVGERYKQIWTRYEHTGISIVFSPTTDPAAAMKVLHKCFERMGGALIGFCKLGSDFCICLPGYSSDKITKAPTLELAIARFAKQLYSK